VNFVKMPQEACGQGTMVRTRVFGVKLFQDGMEGITCNKTLFF
jgi:hypothetical protein